MILACHKINKSFGDHVIIRDGSFHIEGHEKADRHQRKHGGREDGCLSGSAPPALPCGPAGGGLVLGHEPVYGKHRDKAGGNG